MAQAIFSDQYDWRLVALSIVVAFCASYTTVELTGRSVGSGLTKKSFWLTGGALCIGVGLWGIQNLALLAFNLSLLVPERAATLGGSLLVAILCSALSLLAVGWRPLNKFAMLNGSVVLGGCLSAMLYSTIQGLWLGAGVRHSLSLLGISILIALAAAFVSYQPGRKPRETDPADADAADAKTPEADARTDAGVGEKWIALSSAIVMSVAVASIQYAGMAGIDFHSPALASTRHVASSYELSSKIVIIIAALLLNAFGLSLLLSATTRILMNQRGLLQSEQERWRLVISANQDGLFDFDLINGAIFYSPRWKEIIGYKPDELENTLETWQHRIHPEDKELVDSAIEKYLESKQGSGEVAYRLRHKDGSYRWILARSQAVWDDQGQALRLVGSTCDITDRKQTSEELLASEARFSAFMELNPSLSFIKNADGKFIYTNPTFEKLWKLKPGEWIGKSNQEIWPEPLATRVTESDREVLSAKVRSEMIEEFEMPDGLTRQFLTTRFSFPEPGGRRGLGGVSVDLTERMLLEEQLRASESRYWELFEYSPLPSWIYRTRDLRILNVNQAAIDHYGWTRNQFLNLTVRSLLSPEEAETAEADSKQPSPKYRKIRPVRHRRNKKSDIWVELTSHEFEARGNVLRLVMATDVTDRLAFENQMRNQNGYLEEVIAQRTVELESQVEQLTAQLRNLAAQRAAEVKALAAQRDTEIDTLVAQRTAEIESQEAKWHNLVEALPQIVWSARPDGFCDYISRQLAEYTGSPVDALTGWGWLRFVHASDRESVRQAWTAAAGSGVEYEVEYRIKSKAGPYRWFVTRGRPVFSAAGVITHWLGTTSDIHEQKTRKEELEKSAAAARERSEQESRSKQELLASLGGEILTPMNNVMGMTNLILHTSLTAEQRAYIEKVRNSSNSLVKVFNNVLDFSKAEPVQPQLEENEFDLQSLLEDALDSVAAQAGEKNIRLSLHIREGVPFRAVADSGRLRQVLLNLLSNAVKFTERGSVALSVSKLAVEGDSMTLRFGVRDTGVGLSIEEQSALFQPFQQADPAEKPLVAGSGLDIARRAVALMGGDIGVISRPREGSTFWFSLRLVSAAAPVPEELAPLAGKKVLLLISPDSAVLNIGRYLEYASCEVREKESTDGSCSLVIADSASLKALSQSGWHRISHLPIVILGSPPDLSPHLLPAAQPVEYLPQPVRCLALLKAAVQALSRVPAPAPKPAEPAKEELRSPEILLVEDDHINQLITTMFLVKMGYHVTTAGSGKEACAAIDQRAYDLILMDCQMPEMDGFQATRIIREKERAKENGHRHSTPIIALSAGVLKEERDRCRAAGMDDCLPKPLEKQQLESALSTWLNRAETTAV
jgi:PAS domain S-box-containing protein